MPDEKQEAVGRADAGQGGAASPDEGGGQVSRRPPTEGSQKPKSYEEESAPTDPALEPAFRQFQAGNFREARRLAEEVARSQSTESRQAAEAFVERLKPDPLALWLVAGCAVLFVAVIWLTLF